MSIKVYGKSTPQVSLGDKEFLASGGEGDVYSKNGVIYKIYQDASKCIPQKKIDELAPLSQPNIIKPEDLLLNEKGLPVGYTMKFVQDTVALPKLFTTSFLTRNAITPETSQKLVEAIMQGIDYVHSHDILIVDCNEFNFLVDGSTFDKPFFIDVDSWQTPSYPATAIMDSIRDWTAVKWSRESDWFSFAILACQLFIGIHPFKGKHPSVTGLRERQLGLKSVFNSTVSVPDITRDFSAIPPAMMGWFEQIFEKGKRVPPPQVLGKAIIKAQTTLVQGGGALLIDFLGDFGATILGVTWIMATRVTFLSSTAYLDKRPYHLENSHTGIVEHGGRFYFCDSRDSRLSLRNVDSGEELVRVPIMAARVMICENRVYVISADKFSEVVLQDLGTQTHPGIRTSWGILPASYLVFRGFVLSNVLGVPHAYVPFASGMCAIQALPELRGYRVVDAKYENRVLIAVAADSSGTYDEFTYRFNETHSGYELSRDHDVVMSGVNFVALQNGVFVSLTGEGDLHLGTVGGSTKKILTKVGLDRQAVLTHQGLDVYFYSGTKLFRVKMK